MKVELTSIARVTIPAAIRRLGLQAGQPLEFDEDAMRAVVGCARGRLEKTSGEWLDETRGRVVKDDQDRYCEADCEAW